MTGLDPEDSDPSPAGPQDSQSSDQSQSKLRQAWDAWTSRPENNAALLQFGLAMLQPRAPGQSGIGAFANAVGQGAEASERNVAAQQAEAKQASDIQAKNIENQARTTTANAYARQVAQGGGKSGTGMQGALRVQADFRKWLAKPDDALGLTTDPIVGAISHQFPEIKSKADLIGNPAALKQAQSLFAQQFAQPSEDDDGSGGSGASATPTTPGPQPQAAAPVTPPAGSSRIIYDRQGRPYSWDGIQGHAPVPQ